MRISTKAWLDTYRSQKEKIQINFFREFQSWQRKWRHAPVWQTPWGPSGGAHWEGAGNGHTYVASGSSESFSEVLCIILTLTLTPHLRSRANPMGALLIAGQRRLCISKPAAELTLGGWPVRSPSDRNRWTSSPVAVRAPRTIFSKIK